MAITSTIDLVIQGLDFIIRAQATRAADKEIAIHMRDTLTKIQAEGRDPSDEEWADLDARIAAAKAVPSAP